MQHPDPAIIGGHTFRWGERTFIMGILNVSLDSFSGDGIGDPDLALERALEMQSHGADIIDVGGESTRPEARPVSPEDEIARVVPVLRSLFRKLSIPVSIDTYKYEVALRALDAGATMINDVWGLTREPRLAKLAADRGVPVVVASNQRGHSVQDIFQATCEHLSNAVLELETAGLPRNKIIIDPGIGFGKTAIQNLELVDRLNELRALFNLPILLGVSRKSFIGAVLDLPSEERIFGTAASNAVGITRGADIIRVHETRQMRDLARMTDAITRRRRNLP